jgi:hypothetical protein
VLTAGVDSARTVQDFQWDNSFSPLLWASVTGPDGLGARGRWFRFDQSANPLNVAVGSSTTSTTVISSATPLGLAIPGFIPGTPTPGDFAFTSNLKIESWDLEATQAITGNRWSLVLAGGVRYAHLSQNYGAFYQGTTPATFDSLLSGHNFDGVGPEVALDVWRTIGATNISLYATARGGLLFGDSKHSVTETFGTGIVAAEPVTAFANHEQSLPFVELEIGAEYDRKIGRGRAFVQAALVGQEWFGAGNASFDASIPNIPSSDTFSNLGLFGFKLAAGIRY